MKKLVRPLEDAMYTGIIASVKTSKVAPTETIAQIDPALIDNGISIDKIDDLKSRFTFDMKNPSAVSCFCTVFGIDAVEFYSIGIQLDEGRFITTNKFCNKVIWTDKNGDGWTSLDFFTNSIARQLELYDAESDLDVLTVNRKIEFYVSQYTNPKTGAKSYNVDGSRPKALQKADDLGLELED